MSRAHFLLVLFLCVDLQKTINTQKMTDLAFELFASIY